MSGSLAYDGQVSSTDISALKFARLYRPKMKSVYWRYFGFPTNDSDRIITKQNVVCVLCHKVLTNHGNTTNLRAHLQHRHKDIFMQICTENGIKLPTRKNVNRLKYERKMKIEYQEITQDSSNTGSIGYEDQSMLYETMVPMTYEDDEVKTENFSKIEVGNNSDVKSSDSHSTEIVVNDIEPKITTNYRLGIVEDLDSMHIQDALVNIVIHDLRNIRTLFDPGMNSFLRMLIGNNLCELPTEKKMEDLIKELHSDKLTTMADLIKTHSIEKPFSFGFDYWSNIDNKHYISMYFNYTTDAPDYNLINELYCTMEYNDYTPFEAVLCEFNLDNCVAVLVNYDFEDYLKIFLRSKEIPILTPFDSIVDKCLRSVFVLPRVAELIENIKTVFSRYSSEISSKEVEVPIIKEEFPWTTYEFLKFFAETVTWPDDLDNLVEQTKQIVNILGTIAVSLDTLKGEEIPHSSILSPIATKLLDRKLNPIKHDDETLAAVKKAIKEELEKLVTDENHLTVAALLDPRFHRLTKIKHYQSILTLLKDRFAKICELRGTPEDQYNSIKTEQKTSANSRKSILELFFDLEENMDEDTKAEESIVENDLKRYRKEVHVSLDESPFCWWNKMGHNYSSLKQLAAHYQCVPCVINMNFKKPLKQQIYEYQKRYMLNGSLVDAILFLHYNSKLE